MSSLKSPSFDALDDRARAAVLSLAASATEALGAWASRHPCIRAVRAKSVALTFAASAPFCGSEAVVSTARVSLWIFAIDDLFDEEEASFEALVSRAETYRRMIRGDESTVPADDPVGSCLAEIIADLSSYPLFRALRGAWAHALIGTIDAMIRECQWRREYRASKRTRLPSYDDYIANGLYSVGGPPHFMTWIVTIGDASSVEKLPFLQRLAEIASTCIRLANDLQTYEREIAEGNVNSILIFQGGAGQRSVEEARLLVQQQMEERLRECRAHARTDHTRTGATERAFVRLTRFVCEFYASHDFHQSVAVRGGEVTRDATHRTHASGEVERSLAGAAYDTAWIAGLSSPEDPANPRFPRALRWLIENQLADGSWGGELRYEHDRVVSTLAALRALLRFRERAEGAQAAVARAQRYLWQHGHALEAEPAELVAFELLVPTMLHEVAAAGVELPSYLHAYDEERAQKLAMLPAEKLYSPYVTVVHSLEFLGEKVDRTRIANTQGPNGSVGNSPAATAFLLGLGENEAAARYLEQCMDAGAAPVLHPCKMFDLLWCAYHRYIGGTPARHVLSREEYARVRSMLASHGGVSLDESFPIPDADDTAVALILLHECGEEVCWDSLDQFRNAEGYYVSFSYERHPSSGVNFHVLDALRRMPASTQRDTDMRRVVEFLASIRTGGTYWFDKWHISPYYATSHAAVILRDLEGLGGGPLKMAETALDWIRHTQNEDGSWGFYRERSTVEETAYCVLALGGVHELRRDGDASAIEKAHRFMSTHRADPPPPLWIDKCLYLPFNIVNDVVDAALGCAESYDPGQR